MSFKFVRDWFLKAGNETKRQGRKDAAQLWKDGLAHLDAMQASVLEMEPFVRERARQATYNEQHDLNFCSECDEEWGYGHKEGCSVGKAQEILDREV